MSTSNLRLSVHRRVTTTLLVRLFGVLAALSLSFPAAASEIPKELQEVGITEHLGERVTTESLTFRDEAGRLVPLSTYFSGGKPVVLSLVYYECPNLCTLVLNGLLKGLQSLSWTAGSQYELVTVSIDPTETPQLARDKKEAYLASFGTPAAAAGWHFLTGSESQIRKLAGQVGFRYKKDEGQYAHTAGAYVLTADGKLSRYLYGIDYPKNDLRLALLEASNGRIGTVIERLLLFCYRYDPKTRKYSVYLTHLMQAAAVGTTLLVGGLIGLAFWQERRAKFPSLEPSHTHSV